MNRRDLVKEIAAATETDPKTVIAVMDGFQNVTLATVAKGDPVVLTGFAKFAKVKRAARMGRNPATGEPVKIKASTKAKITPLKGFKDVVSGAAAAPKIAKAAAGVTAAKKGATASKAAPAATKAAAATTKATTATKAGSTTTSTSAAKSTGTTTAKKAAPATKAAAPTKSAPAAKKAAPAKKAAAPAKTAGRAAKR